ncbi:MAG: alpha/beta hydrolase [Candidatus Cryptobacteroides sp.]
MKKIHSLLIGIALLQASLVLDANERMNLWSKGKMPDAQDHQIAAMTDESRQPGFDAGKHRTPYLEWFDAPSADKRNGGCMVLISGGSYQSCFDVDYIRKWSEQFTELGFQCVNLVYRTPRPEGLPIYQTAWEDGQRAIRLVRNEAAKRGFNPEKIGTVSMSAGSHLALLLATSSQTRAYQPVDKLDSLSCHINIAIVFAPAYGTTDGETGTPALREGYGTDVQLSDVFRFDGKTCPMSLHHGGLDPYTPTTSTLVYRQLRKMHIPAELHLYADRGHATLGLDRGVEFLCQMGWLGDLDAEVPIMDIYNSDDARAEVIREDVWQDGKMPDAQEHQCQPYIEWHIPKNLTTKAIQIIYSGGAYVNNDPNGFEVAPARRYLNEKGMTVVTLKYRTPRPKGLSKHTTAWEDLQRTIRIVRSEAAERGLDPDRIGIMGSSAGGHLTLMGVTSSLHKAYLPIDDIDKLPCNVQWGVGIYPAYSLTDGSNDPNTNGGNEDSDILVPEFSFDLKTAPMIFIHGDADGWAAMNSVKCWEKMRAMGIQCDLHTLATRDHCFQHKSSPGTGSYTHLDRIWDFLKRKGFVD